MKLSLLTEHVIHLTRVSCIKKYLLLWLHIHTALSKKLLKTILLSANTTGERKLDSYSWSLVHDSRARELFVRALILFWIAGGFACRLFGFFAPTLLCRVLAFFTHARLPRGRSYVRLSSDLIWKSWNCYIGLF